MDSLSSKLPHNTIDLIGIGSLHFLGAFMIIDSYTAWYGWVEVMSRAPIWTVVVAIPLLFFSYIIGFISIVISDFLFSLSGRRTKEKEFDEFIKIALSENTAIIHDYLERNKSRRVLSGVALGFLTVAVGIFFRISKLYAQFPGNIHFAYQIMGIGFIFLAVVCIVLAIFLVKQNELLSNKLEAISQSEE